MSAVTNAIAKLTNIEMWDSVRKFSPTFASHTSEATKELFTEAGFSELTSVDNTILNDFFRLSIRVSLNLINISSARDPLADKGFGEAYQLPYGGIIQRMAVDSIKPINPAYKNLRDGQSVDPFIVRKPKISERFYKQNFDYQSFITMQNFNLKQAFISEYGVSELVAGIMQGLENGWIIQKYTNKLEVLNAALSDENIKDNQLVGIDYTGNWTKEELTAFIQKAMDIVSMMVSVAQTSAFNMAGFSSVQDKTRLKLLIRSGYTNALRVQTLAGTYNPEQLDIGIDVIEVENFGGIKYQLTGGTPLFPAYNAYGEEIGLNEQEDQLVATHQITDPDVVAIDPNADIVAIIADKGFIFETYQNEYTVETIHNPRGLYDNYFASAPNNAIHYDRNYNFVVFKKAKKN